MNNITQLISEKGNLSILNEPTDSGFKMFNTGGVECEVGEFLYSMVRIMKPKEVLETGTHCGISSTYMGLALKENGLGGKITTLDLVYHEEAKKLHSALELNEFIKQIEGNSLNFCAETTYSMVLLDTEPILRFAEFEKFYDSVTPGGLIIIHDLHPNLSYNTFQDKSLPYSHWPFGNFIPTIGDKFIKKFRVQLLSLPTPRGITIFQKESYDMSYITFLKTVYDFI
jgi:hypothetical protein